MQGDDLQFLHGKYHSDYSFCVEKRYERYAALQFMSTGSVELTYDSTHYSLEGAWMWPCHPGPLIRFEPGPSGQWEHRYVAIAGPRWQQWQASGLWPRQPQAVTSPDVAQRFDLLLATFPRNTPWSQARAVNQLEGLLLELADQRDSHVQRYEVWLEDCLRRMAAARYQHCDYAEIAESWGMSVSTLRRRFRQQMGMSIHQYALNQRLAEAQRLLRESDLPIKAIADQLAYQDVFFFSRQFKQYTGVTPGMYRKTR